MGEGVDKIAIGVLLQTLQGYGTASGKAEQALQLVEPMGGDLGVGVQGKALDAGTAGTRQRGRLTLGAKACANAPHPLAKGDALLYRGGHGVGEFGSVIDQRIIAGGHRRVEARLQVSQPPQRADDSMADLLDHRSNVGIGGGLTLDKTRPQSLGSAVHIDAFKENRVKMQIQIDRTAKTLDKGDRSRLDVGSREASCDGFVRIILPNRRMDNRMDLRGEVL